ncbi:glycoside hydrolase family 2 protein [Georgenia halophila]|uniref:beta-mannosidase n=1 Tax=Georgenia halophila TaxID=620889 RepID=A0ABP8KVA0_9MICO
METTTLHEGWTLRHAGGEVPGEIDGVVVPATVPGSAHTDLLEAGLIPDPYLGENETALAWAHRADWVYETTFTAEPAAAGERVDLAFDGLDTVATIMLNGTELGRTENMHRRYRFDVTALLAAENSLTVHLHSALARAEEVAAEVGPRPHSYPHPFNAIRKMACSFGWDWGPDLQTAGIWRPVRLERWQTARLSEVRPLVTVGPDGTGRAEVLVDVETAAGAPSSAVRVRAALTAPDGATRAADGEVAVRDGRAALVLDVPDAELWWPHGYGAQPRYDLAVTLVDGEQALDDWSRKIGFRNVVVRTDPDEIGTSFTIEINGTPIFAKGANWIPDDHFLTRVTPDRYARRVDQAIAANMNLLRIWGGGVYEDDAFYDACDARGVLVWQDFLLACAAYAEDEPIWSELEAEARDNVVRLMSHPSLAIWNGGNENLWGFMDWGWQPELDGATWGYGYYHELFPQVLAELDPTRAYVEGSPTSPGFAPWGKHPNDPDHGLKHEWQVWNQVDYSHYRDEAPRFVSEFGFQGPPTWATLTRALDPDDLHKESSAFLLHQKAPDGNGKLDRGLAPHLPVPEDFTDWHWATQLNQAHAVRFALEHYRSHWPRTAGAIVWQINDCWPVTSWAAVDGDERPKPLWYAMRAAYAPRILTVQPRDGRLVVAVVNDTDQPWSGVLSLSRHTLDGAVPASSDVTAEAGPRSVELVDVPADLATAGDPAREVLVAALGDVRTVHLYAENKDLALDPDAVTATAAPASGGYDVTITATSLALDVTVLADRLAPDAVTDRALDPLLAGESVTVHVATAAAPDPGDLTGAPVLRSSNALHAAVGHPSKL